MKGKKLKSDRNINMSLSIVHDKQGFQVKLNNALALLSQVF